MKNKILFCVLFSLFISSVFAQHKTLSSIDKEVLKKEVVKKSKSIATLQSDFIQIKHLSFLSKDIESQGKLWFKAPNAIKWVYTSPFQYSAIFKDDQLFINDEGRKNKISLKSNKTFESLNHLLIKSVTGNMFDELVFEISYFENDIHYGASFYPKDKNIKKFIHQFELYFSKQNFQVEEVKMIESSEDYTLLKFKNQKYNNALRDADFNP